MSSQDMSSSSSSSSRGQEDDDDFVSISCFICNKSFPLDSSIAELIATKLAVDVLQNVWGQEKEQTEGDGDISPSMFGVGQMVGSCKTCADKLRTISDIYSELQLLSQRMSRLKGEIEQLVQTSQSKDIKEDEDDDEGLVPEEDYYAQLLTNGRTMRTTFINYLKPKSGSSSGITRKEEEGSGIAKSKDSSSSTDLAVRTEFQQDVVGEDDGDNDDTKGDTSDSKDRISCNMCTCTFNDESSQMVHYRKIHEGQSHPYHCETCAKTFKRKNEYSVHMMVHKNETPFICEFCGKGFRISKLLTYHIKNIHKPEECEFKCKECPLQFATARKLKVHTETHSKDLNFGCSFCGKAFKTKQSLDTHSVQHSQNNPWRCSLCGKYFSCHSALKTHAASHLADGLKFRCDECSFSGPSKSSLDRHMIAHSSEKQFKCEECGSQFKHKKSLQTHLKGHNNNGDKNFQCSLCDKRFVSLYKLRRHAQTHDSQPQFTCQVDDECGRTFYSKDALNSHAKRHGPGEDRIASSKRSKVEGQKSSLQQKARIVSHKTQSSYPAPCTSVSAHSSVLIDPENQMIRGENPTANNNSMNDSFMMPASSVAYANIELPMSTLNSYRVDMQQHRPIQFGSSNIPPIPMNIDGINSIPQFVHGNPQMTTTNRLQSLEHVETHSAPLMYVDDQGMPFVKPNVDSSDGRPFPQANYQFHYSG